MMITRVIDGREVNIELTPEEVKAILAEDRGSEGGQYFGIVRWCDEDLANALTGHGYQASEDNIAELRTKLEHHSFTDHMISAGWDFIESCIFDIEQDLEEKPWKATYKCSICGETFTYDSEEDFQEYGEEALWGHIQIDHPEAFQECQNLETPHMLKLLYWDVTELPEDINPGDYTIEWCPYCEAEQVVYTEGITSCQCGATLLPCSACEGSSGGCSTETCPYKDVAEDEEKRKSLAKPAIPAELAKKLYKVL